MAQLTSPDVPWLGHIENAVAWLRGGLDWNHIVIAEHQDGDGSNTLDVDTLELSSLAAVKDYEPRWLEVLSIVDRDWVGISPVRLIEGTLIVVVRFFPGTVPTVKPCVGVTLSADRQLAMQAGWVPPDHPAPAAG